MINHSVLGYFGIGGGAVAVVAIGVDAYASTRSKFAPNFDIFGFHQNN